MAERRHKSDDIPTDLRARRDQLKLSREVVAADLEIDPSTLQRWEMPPSSEHHRRISAADHARLLAYYDAKGADRHGSSVPRGTPISGRLSTLVNSFERDMVRLGATDDEADYIRSALTTEGARKFYMGDQSKPLTAEQQEHELKMQMEALKLWVTLRIKARKDAERKR